MFFVEFVSTVEFYNFHAVIVAGWAISVKQKSVKKLVKNHEKMLRCNITHGKY
jgi:hypothetical protein